MSNVILKKCTNCEYIQELPFSCGENIFCRKDVELAYEKGQNQPKWIPVSEMLPEDFEGYKGKEVIDVLITTANGRVTKVQRKYDKWIGEWYFARIYSDVIAWMPMPQKYKKEV